MDEKVDEAFTSLTHTRDPIMYLFRNLGVHKTMGALPLASPVHGVNATKNTPAPCQGHTYKDGHMDTLYNTINTAYCRAACSPYVCR